MAGIPGCVGGNRWRHTSPHGQQGENGSARSCPQLYCSFVQYTSKKLTWRWGGNTRYAPPCGGAPTVLSVRQRQNSLCFSYTYTVTQNERLAACGERREANPPASNRGTPPLYEASG